ncbi:MAG: OprO/OprP family phosphate-selective porin [Mariprofundaceae bacterium]|nr:OprO/OprP family phosphate-selective porin [Mariprofundaceae bacterium]
MQKKTFNPWRFGGMALAVMLTIPALSGSANAGGTSLVDLLEAKGVLTQGEAKAAKAEAKAHQSKLKIGGRIQADAAFYKDDPGLDMGDGAEFRRARLFVKGKVGDFHYKAQYDFAGNGTKIKDLYIKYTGLPVHIKVGNFKEPFSLEELTSSKYITFMERAMPNTFAPSRHIGAALSGHGDSWSAAAGVFTNGASGTTSGVDSQFDATGRLTFAPIHEKTRVLHLGAGINYSLPSSTRTLRFRERPESHVTHKRLVGTGDILNVDSVLKYDLEAAAVFGPASIQGEYSRTDVSFQNGIANEPSFSGYYIFGSWFLTGESRPYSVKKGSFGRVHPNHNFQLGADGWGAWEVAARFSQLDLEDTGFPGGKEQNITVGLNWYPHPHLRWMFNWVHASVDRSPITTVARNNFGPDVFQMRAQVDF